MTDTYVAVLFFTLLLMIIIRVLDCGLFNQSSDDCFKEAVRKVTYEEHEYLIYNDSGVCHYPECKCKTKGETNEENRCF